MNLNEVRQLALQKMEEHGLFELGYKFEFFNSKTVAGRCTIGGNHSHFNKIKLSAPLMNLATYEDVLGIILHEIAHALTPFHGHDWVWRKKLIEIGGDGLVYYTKDSAPSIYHAAEKTAKYKAVCPNGHVVYFNRKPKYRKSCAKCYPSFNENYLFILKPNV